MRQKAGVFGFNMVYGKREDEMQRNAVEVDPDFAVAGQVGRWQVRYTAESRLEAGCVLSLERDYSSQLRFAWQSTDPAAPNHVEVDVPSGASVQVATEPARVTATLVSGVVERGGMVVFRLGSAHGFEVWPVVHDMGFSLEVQPAGHEHSLRIRVVSAPPAALRIKAPSVIGPAEQASVLVRAVDEHGNTAEAFEGTVRLAADASDVSPAQVDLRPADAGRREVSLSLTGSGPGVAIRVNAVVDGAHLHGSSNAVARAAEEEPQRIFWGDIHCHSNLAQALESPEFLYSYARDEEALDFICNTEHDAGTEDRWVEGRWRDWRPAVGSVQEYIEATWQYRKELVRKHYEPGRFVTLLGYEWASNLYGHANVYYASDNEAIFYPHDFWDEDFTPAELWRRLAGIEAFTVPHHVSHRIRSRRGGFVSGWDWRFYDPQLVPLVEVYSKHGSSEYFGCPRAIGDQVAEGCVDAALARGCRLGFVANTDTHASRPGSDLSGDLNFRQGGLTAVFARQLDRPSVFDALRSRRCYGTTGQRIIVRFSVNDSFMGEHLSLPDSRAAKTVRFSVEGTGRLATVAVVKNNKVVHSESPAGTSVAAEYVDHAPTEATDFYYLRLLQQDGEMAWSSPVWVSG